MAATGPVTDPLPLTVAPVLHRSEGEIERGLAHMAGSPGEEGRLDMVVRRPAIDEREVLMHARIEPGAGLVGDSWSTRTKVSPEAEITLASSRFVALLAGSEDRWPLAGDQLYVDLDLSHDNLPIGSRLRIGTVVLEITGKPHKGCWKFQGRFGKAALQTVVAADGRRRRLRGVNTRVVTGGDVRVGDAVRKEPAVTSA